MALFRAQNGTYLTHGPIAKSLMKGLNGGPD